MSETKEEGMTLVMAREIIERNRRTMRITGEEFQVSEAIGFIEGHQAGIDKAMAEAEKLKKALLLSMEVFERVNSSPEINFLGDDDHEAYRVNGEALSNWNKFKKGLKK